MATSHDRDGGTIRPSLVAPSPRRRQRRLSPTPQPLAPFAERKGARRRRTQRRRAGDARLPSAGRAGSGFPKMDRRVARWGPRNTSHTAQPGRRGRSVIRGRVRCQSHFVAWERRRRELEYKPVIDTARSTAGEGHVARHGDVRRVRKVHVDCSASRTLRGQPPAQTSSRRRHSSFPRELLVIPAHAGTQSKANLVIPADAGIQGKANLAAETPRKREPIRQLRRTETVGNRLTQKPTTKPLPKPKAEAQTQEPSRKKTRNTTARALTRVYDPNSSSPTSPRHSRERGKPEKSKPCRIERRRRFPSPPKRPSTAEEGQGEGTERCGARRTPPAQHPNNNQNPSFHIMAIMVLPLSPKNAHQQRERARVRARGSAGPEGLPQRNTPNNQHKIPKIPVQTNNHNPSFKSFLILAIMVPHPKTASKRVDVH